MERYEIITLLICGILLFSFNILNAAETKIIIPPNSTDIIVCTTDSNGVVVCL